MFLLSWNSFVNGLSIFGGGLYAQLYWIIPVIAGLLLAFFWQPIMGLWMLLPSKARVVLYFVFGGFILYLFGVNRGEKAAKDRSDAANARAVQRKAEIKDEVSKLDKVGVDRKLRESGWMRQDDDL